MHARMTWVPVTAVVLVVAILLQGCVLARKTISDTYTSIQGVSDGVEQQEIHMIFSKEYCIPNSDLKFKGHLMNLSSPPPPTLQMIFRRYNTSDDLLNTWTFNIGVGEDGRIRKQVFLFSAVCFLAGEGLRAFAKPIGGNIDTGAALFFLLALLALDEEEDEEF